MKVNRLLKIALFGLSAVALIPTGQVFGAADGTGRQTYYPVTEEQDGKFVKPFERDLSFENSPSDYAIHGDDYAFAYSTTVYVLTTNESDERQLMPHVHTSEVRDIDFDANGTLYYRDLLGATFTVTYSGESAKATAYEGEYTFQSKDKSKIDISDEVFYSLNKTNGELNYWNDGVPTPVDEGFSVLKTYDGEIYALKDNRPYKITERKATELSLAYINTDGAKNIATGDTATKLKQVASTVKIARIKSGSYYTQINMDEIGDTFTVDERGGTQKAIGNRSCLVLCESGNASIISMGSDCFITATENLEDDGICQSNTDGKTYYSLIDVGVYSSPFMSAGTRIATLKSGAEHPVKVLERFIHTVFDTEFCKVSYEEDGKTVTGFIASNFLNVYNFSAEDKKPSEGGDEEFDYGTNVTSVVLAIIIVALVIIAILYVSLISAKGKGKSKKAKKKLISPKSNDDPDLEE